MRGVKVVRPPLPLPIRYRHHQPLTLTDIGHPLLMLKFPRDEFAQAPAPAPASQRLRPKTLTTPAMLATTIRSPPSVEDYIPLSDYQSQTPESFSDGKPVLHFHLKGAVASIPKSQCGTLTIFPTDSPSTENAVARTNGDAEELVEQKVDVFVNSEYVSLSSINKPARLKLTLHQTLHNLQRKDGIRRLNTLPIHLHPRSQASHRARWLQHTRHLDAARVLRRGS